MLIFKGETILMMNRCELSPRVWCRLVEVLLHLLKQAGSCPTSPLSHVGLERLERGRDFGDQPSPCTIYGVHVVDNLPRSMKGSIVVSTARGLSKASLVPASAGLFWQRQWCTA